MTKTVHGKVRGRTIELDEDLGVSEGQEVEVTVTVVQATNKWSEGIPEGDPWGEGLRRCAGALAGIPGLDEDMRQILQERKIAKFREVPE
ncbi:MAG TPA: hypothetical protein VND64_14705 [Pirellulales bacterium]|nr:hypothetical protein [Pirellulales bacterium]